MARDYYNATLTGLDKSTALIFYAWFSHISALEEGIDVVDVSSTEKLCRKFMPSLFTLSYNVAKILLRKMLQASISHTRKATVLYSLVYINYLEYTKMLVAGKQSR